MLKTGEQKRQRFRLGSHTKSQHALRASHMSRLAIGVRLLMWSPSAKAEPVLRQTAATQSGFTTPTSTAPGTSDEKQVRYLQGLTYTTAAVQKHTCDMLSPAFHACQLGACTSSANWSTQMTQLVAPLLWIRAVLASLRKNPAAAVDHQKPCCSCRQQTHAHAMVHHVSAIPAVCFQAAGSKQCAKLPHLPRVIAWLCALRSPEGAHTYTSISGLCARASTNDFSPGAWMPSSLLTST